MVKLCNYAIGIPNTVQSNLMCSNNCLTLMHPERPKLYTILAFLSAKGLKKEFYFDWKKS